MVSFTIVAGLALLTSSAAATPLLQTSTLVTSSELVTRQEQMPPTCTDYCSPSSGCVCIVRPTNCKS